MIEIYHPQYETDHRAGYAQWLATAANRLIIEQRATANVGEIARQSDTILRIIPLVDLSDREAQELLAELALELESALGEHLTGYEDITVVGDLASLEDWLP